jgi:hypothetical protein
MPNAKTTGFRRRIKLTNSESSDEQRCVPAVPPQDDRRRDRDLVDPEDIRDAIIGIILRGCPKRGVR